MAVIENSAFIKYKDEDGNVYLVYPITTKDNVDGLDEIETELATAVKFVSQDLTEEQKTQARANIGAAKDVLYYDSLSLAMTDINAGTKTNVSADISTAKVKVFTAETGRLTVMLIDDVTESTQININKDIDLVLNGKTISFTTSAACLYFGTGTSCVVDGMVDGSTITKVCTSTSGVIYILNTVGNKLVVKGGAYSISGANFKMMGFRLAPPCEVEINGVDLSVVNPSTASGAYARAVQYTGNSKLSILNSTISADGYAIATGIYAGGTAEYCAEFDRTVIHTNVTSNVDTSSSYGMEIYKNVTAVVSNSTIVSDAPGCHSDESCGIGVMTCGDFHCINSIITGTHSGIQNIQSTGTKPQLYINGGTYTGYCHGGIYFSHGADGIAYVNDATFRCGNYEGIHDYSGKTAERYGCMYVGGGSDEKNSNITVYMDGCTFGGGDSAGNAIVLRGSSGEQNNTVNVSNSTIVDGQGGIRIDNETHKLNIGIGGNITTDKIGNSDYAEFTGKLYRRNRADKVLDGNDYNALARFMESIDYINAEEVAY